MTPFLPQAPPRPLPVSQISCGGPPSALIFFNLPAAKKAICLLSGDQKGYMASSVPGTDCAVREFSDCTYSKTLLFASRAVNAIRVPSGESTGGPEAGTMVTNDASVGGRIEERTTCTDFGACKKWATAMLIASSVATPAISQGESELEDAGFDVGAGGLAAFGLSANASS